MSNAILEIKRKRLELYYEAEEKVLNSQSYTLGSKTLTRADLMAIQNMIKNWKARLHRLNSTERQKEGQSVLFRLIRRQYECI